MLRISLIAAAFLSVTITLIAMQPSAPRAPAFADATAPEVTRARTNLDTLTDFSTAESAAPDSDDGLRAATFGLPGKNPGAAHPAYQVEAPEALKLVSLPDPGSPQPGQNALEQLIVTAFKQGQSEADIEALIDDAVRNGEGDISTSLTSPQSPSGQTGSNQTYTVQPGDSLASISYRFFGRTDRHTDIYNANRSKLSAAGQIKVGQQLIIPGT